jgi:NitT/TauT family transport system substrate-binding protein
MRRRLFLLSAGALAAAAPRRTRAQAQRVSVGALALTSSAPVFIALARGYFREQGLDVERKTFTAAQQVPVAVTSGDADFGVTGLTAGFYNLAGRGALRIIAAQSREAPGFQLNAYMATNAAHAAGLRGLGDLPGRRVGITTVGSTFHYSLGLLARKYNFDLARVTMVPLQTLPNMAAAFKGGQVEAIVVPVNLARQLESEGAGRILGWVGDETPWQLGALFTSPRMIAERRETVQRFIRAYVRGCADYNRACNQRDAAGRAVQGEGYREVLDVIAQAVQQRVEIVERALPFVDAAGRLDVGDIHNQVAFWQASGQASRDVDARAILDLSFVEGHLNVPA